MTPSSVSVEPAQQHNVSISLALAGPKVYGASGVTPYPTIAFVGNSHMIMYGGILSELADEYQTSIGFVTEVIRE